MTLEGLKRILIQPENEHIEYKEAKNQFDIQKLMKYCVALANEGGGKLILGVNNKRNIVGTKAFLNSTNKCNFI